MAAWCDWLWYVCWWWSQDVVYFRGPCCNLGCHGTSSIGGCHGNSSAWPDPLVCSQVAYCRITYSMCLLLMMGETTATCWLTALKARLPMSSRWCPIRALSVLLNTNLTNCMQVCHNNGLVMWTFDVFFVACLNSLRPSEAIWRPRCGSTLRSSDSHLTEVSFARDTNELTCYMDGIALWKHKSYLQFLWFLNIDDTGSWNPSSWRSRTCLCHAVNTMAADVLASWRARASAVMVLT